MCISFYVSFYHIYIVVNDTQAQLHSINIHKGYASNMQSRLRPYMSHRQTWNTMKAQNKGQESCACIFKYILINASCEKN